MCGYFQTFSPFSQFNSSPFPPAKSNDETVAAAVAAAAAAAKAAKEQQAEDIKAGKVPAGRIIDSIQVCLIFTIVDQAIKVCVGCS